MNKLRKNTFVTVKEGVTDDYPFYDDLPLIYIGEICGVHSVDTKSEIVKILHFKQFYKHYVFNEDGDGGRKKVLKNYIDVYVCIDMVCGDTKNDLGSEE